MPGVSVSSAELARWQQQMSRVGPLPGMGMMPPQTVGLSGWGGAHFPQLSMPQVSADFRSASSLFTTASGCIGHSPLISSLLLC